MYTCAFVIASVRAGIRVFVLSARVRSHAHTYSHIRMHARW